MDPFPFHFSFLLVFLFPFMRPPEACCFCDRLIEVHIELRVCDHDARLL
jgi:hypothetical protein